MDQFLERDIQYLKGVGDKRARLFHKLGIFVVGDLVRYYPRTYEDWSVTTPAAQAPEGTPVCVQATMVTPMRTHLIRKGMTLYKADFTDGETLIHVTLFNTKFLAEKLRMYQDYLLLGKVERNFTTVQMSAPKIEPLTARRIHPIYTQTGSLNANLIAKAVDYALAHMAPLPDTLSPALREKYGLEDLDTAVRNIHFPSNAKALEAARHRLIFEELLALTIGLKKCKGRKRTPTTRIIKKDCTAAFAAHLPFTLTGAQQKVWKELEVVTPSTDFPVRRMSGGNVQKVLVGREIAQAPAVLMTAYAVRGLDINTSYTIYNLLTEQKMKGIAVMYVGEDLDVLLELCDRIVVLCGGQVSGVVDARTADKRQIGALMTRMEGGKTDE